MAGTIFISYRRDDSAGATGRIYDRLERDFGKPAIILDVADVPLAADFTKVLIAKVKASAVLLVIIGARWLSITDKQGQRRIDDPRDPVRIEIEAGLQANIPIVPVLLDGAKIPHRDELPESIKDLSDRNGIELRSSTFHADMDRLVAGLKFLLAYDRPKDDRTILWTWRGLLHLLFRLSVMSSCFVGTFIVAMWAGSSLISWAEGQFPPDIGNPSHDPSGRGATDAAAVIPVGIAASIILASIGGWLGWLLSSRKNWSADLLVGAPVFLLFSVFCQANYMRHDTVFTFDAQAVLNIPFATSGMVVFFILTRSVARSQYLFPFMLGLTLLIFLGWGFVAIPLWYSISYLSWRLGNGELSGDFATYALLAALLAVFWSQRGTFARLFKSPPDQQRLG